MEHDAPRAAEALGLVERYSYLRGASGKRYLFTSVPDAADNEYPGAVVVLTTPDSARRVVWVGEVDERGYRHGPRLPRRRARRTSTLVHLLAEDPSIRRQIIRDLRQGLETPVAAE